MSGFVPKRVSQARTAMGSTDANSTGKNGHSIVSTIGRRSTLLRGIQTRSFGSMWQIDYLNAAGNKCRQEELVPTFSTDPITLSSGTQTAPIGIPITIHRDGNTAGFVRKSLQNALVKLYGGNVFTDKFCAMGNISGNVGDNIIAPNDITVTNIPATLFNNETRTIIAVERWLTAGWSDFNSPSPPATAGDGNGLVVVYSGGPFNLGNAPSIKLSGVNGGNLIIPRAVRTSQGNGGPIANFGGIDIGPFVVVLYGGNTNAGTTALDNEFIAGLPVGGTKSFTLEIVKT